MCGLKVVIVNCVEIMGWFCVNFCLKFWDYIVFLKWNFGKWIELCYNYGVFGDKFNDCVVVWVKKVMG